MKKFCLLILSALCFTSTTHADLVVLSDRPLDRIKPAIDLFEKQTGQTVKFIEANYDKMEPHFNNPQNPIDIIILKDLVFVGHAQQKGLFQKLLDHKLYSQVYPFAQDENGEWIGLTYRVRSLIYSLDVESDTLKQIQNYSDLSSPILANNLCVRTSNHSYNFALGANMIEAYGKAKAVDLFSGIRNNLAKEPLNGDRAIIQAVANGECQFGLINSYYLGAEFMANPRLAVGFKFLNDSTGGSHTNGSAAAIAKSSTQPQLAQLFIEALLNDRALIQNAQTHLDYPAKLSLSADYLPITWRQPNLSSISWNQMIRNLIYVPELFRSANYK